MEEKNIQKVDVIQSKCPKCGSELSFDPESQSLICRNCNYKQDIQKDTTSIEEYNYQEYLEKYNQEKGNVVDNLEIKCSDCGASFLVNPKAISTICPFCESNRTIKQSSFNTAIKIEGVIPFTFAKEDVQPLFLKFLQKKFWAPRKFKKGHSLPTYSAFYIPFWTYDAQTFSEYNARRGDYYYVTVTTRVNGRPSTRSERRIRWTFVRGTYKYFFDDVLVRGTNNGLNQHIDKIKNYDLTQLTKFDEQFLLGFYAEKPAIDIENGFANARQIMGERIRSGVTSQIGGDVVSNLNIKTSYDEICFKQIMCPIYNGTYKYKNKTYHFIINGQTKKISADYPVSSLKIFLVVLGILAIICLTIVLILL